MTDTPRDPWTAPTCWVDSGSGPGWDVPADQLDELPAPSFLPRLSKLRGIRPAVPGPVLPTLTGPAIPAALDPDDDPDHGRVPPDFPVPPDVEVDALKTILERHVTGADGICFCGERAGQFTGRCRTARRAAKQLTALGFAGYDVPPPPGWKTSHNHDHE